MKQTVLILGAGRSSIFLIEHLLQEAEKLNISVVVADSNLEAALLKTKQHPLAQAVELQNGDIEGLKNLIRNAHLVISLLPASEHVTIAKICLEFRKNMLTASYANSEMYALHQKAIENGVTIMMECGLDPGIDHMSAMKIIHQLKNEGAEITAFQSFCGGLVSPESDDNPFHYKISWAPQNVVLAGQGGNSVYRKHGEQISVPYHELFSHTNTLQIPNFGNLEAYPNRNSLQYEHIYELEGIPTMLRGTLRYPDFCEAWQLLVKLFYTNNWWDISQLHPLTFLELTEHLTTTELTKEKLATHLSQTIDSKSFKAIKWLGIIDDILITKEAKTPAQALQYLLENKLKLQENDKDLVVMHHIFDYKMEGKENKKTSTMILKGENKTYTAMAKTVGLPLAIVAKKFIKHMEFDYGVQLPISPTLYLPVLKELEKEGVRFVEG